MTLAKLLSSGEFWAALFGALAAFILAAFGKWWAATNAKRTAGNLTLIALSQMYSLIENLRRQLFGEELKRQAALLGREPFMFEIRAAIGIADRDIRLPAEHLGFLADSDDPDVLNRLLTVERAYGSMLDLARRHAELHTELQERMAEIDKTGTMEVRPADFPQLVGVHLVMQLNATVKGLEEGLPETRDSLLRIAGQLRGVLRMQFPARRFIGFEAAPGTDRRIDSQPQIRPPALWRRTVRRVADTLRPRPVKALPSPKDCEAP